MVDLYILSMGISLWLAIYSFKYKKVPGVKYFIVLMLLGAMVSMGSIFEYSSTTLAAKLFWHNFEQFDFFFSPIACLFLVLEYSTYDRFVQRTWLIGLSVVPTVGLSLIFSDPILHLMRKSAVLNAQGILVLHLKWLDTVFLSYNYFIYFAALLVLAKTVHFSHGKSKKQLLALITGFLIPLVYGLLEMTKLANISPYFNSISISLIPMDLLIFWGLLKYQLFEVIPIARNKVFDVMKEGIVVLDSDGNILDYNESAIQVFQSEGPLKNKMLYGKTLDQVLSSSEQWLRAHHMQEEMEFELSICVEDQLSYFQIKVIPVFYKGNFHGTLSVLSNITENKRMSEILHLKATVDGMTGIYNHTTFMEMTDKSLQNSMLQHSPLAMIMFDIDHFKKINDRFGHQTGDLTLRTFVEVALRHLQEPYIFGRIGGEEFALTLPGMNQLQAFQLAEEIRKAVAKGTFVSVDGRTFNCTVSIGVCSRDQSIVTIENLYANADRSLYEAKQLGRNRTCVWDADVHNKIKGDHLKFL